jgi:NAD(P)-dependent dehydrogenase (short-subunit alcohol dehydrogenase family)
LVEVLLCFTNIIFEDRLFQALTKYRPRIDVLANVAGIMDSFSGADTMTDAEWNKVLGVNLTAPTKLMRAVLVYMKEAKSGAIVNVSSKAGSSGAAAGIAYTTSKHGLVSRHGSSNYENLDILELMVGTDWCNEACGLEVP